MAKKQTVDGGPETGGPQVPLVGAGVYVGAGQGQGQRSTGLLNSPDRVQGSPVR